MAIPLPSLPPDNTEICLVIPNSPEWRQIYMGALQILAQWWYWDVENASESQDVIQRVMSCAYLTGINYEGCMELDCNDVADCIDNSDSVRDALVRLIDSNSAENARINGQSQNLTGIGDGSNPTCDLDVLWAQCFGLVETLHTYNLEFFDKLEEASNSFEFLSDVLGTITGLDEFSIDTIFAWYEYVVTNIQENYATQATLGYREQLACEIFCDIRDSDCNITPTAVYDILSSRMGNIISIDGLISDVLGYLISGSWSGTEIADFMFLSQTSVRSLVGKWFAENAWNPLDLILRLYVNDANDDWSLLCTDCGWSYISEFDVSPNDWIAGMSGSTPLADYVALDNWYSVDVHPSPTSWQTWLQIEITFASPVYIDSFKVNYDFNSGGSPDPRVRIESLLGGVIKTTTSADGTNGSDLTLEHFPNQMIDGMKFIARPSSSVVNSTLGWVGSVAMLGIEITGTGIKPPELET